MIQIFRIIHSIAFIRFILCDTSDCSLEAPMIIPIPIMPVMPVPLVFFPLAQLHTPMYKFDETPKGETEPDTVPTEPVDYVDTNVPEDTDETDSYDIYTEVPVVTYPDEPADSNEEYTDDAVIYPSIVPEYPTETHTEPENPTERETPIEPTEPDTPTEIIRPTEPTEPDTPTEIIRPTEPTTTERRKSTEPDKPSESVTPTETTSKEPDKQTEVTKSVKSTIPTEVKKSTEVTLSIETTTKPIATKKNTQSTQITSETTEMTTEDTTTTIITTTPKKPYSNYTVYDVITSPTNVSQIFAFQKRNMSGSVNVQVKSGGSAFIRLISKDALRIAPPFYTIVLGDSSNTRSVLYLQEKHAAEKLLAEAKKPILRNDEYRDFIITWDSTGMISIQEKYELVPLLSWKNPVPFPIGAIGVASASPNQAIWNLGPNLKELPKDEDDNLRRYNYGENKWITAKYGQVPSQAVVGGHTCNHEAMYVARAYHDGILFPGKLITSTGCTTISLNGRVYCRPEYQVLVAGTYRWISSKKTDADLLRTRSLQTCRVHIGCSLVIGRVHRHRNLCNIAHEGKELSLRNYEVLQDF